MKQRIACISLLVRDYDEAIDFFVGKLQFNLVEDTAMEGGKRWVLVAPPGSDSARILLAKAANPAQLNQVGNQTGGRVFLFLHTDDFWRDYQKMQANGIFFTKNPTVEPYGIVAVFRDIYGNLWDFIQPAN